MDPYTGDEELDALVAQHMATLDPNLKRLFDDPASSIYIESFAGSAGLSAEQADDLKHEIMLMILGFTPVDDFSFILMTELNMPPRQAFAVEHWVKGVFLKDSMEFIEPQKKGEEKTEELVPESVVATPVVPQEMEKTIVSPIVQSKPIPVVPSQSVLVQPYSPAQQTPHVTGVIHNEIVIPDHGTAVSEPAYAPTPAPQAEPEPVVTMSVPPQAPTPSLLVPLQPITIPVVQQVAPQPVPVVLPATPPTLAAVPSLPVPLPTSTPQVEPEPILPISVTPEPLSPLPPVPSQPIAIPAPQNTVSQPLVPAASPISPVPPPAPIVIPALPKATAPFLIPIKNNSAVPAIISGMQSLDLTKQTSARPHTMLEDITKARGAITPDGIARYDKPLVATPAYAK